MFELNLHTHRVIYESHGNHKAKIYNTNTKNRKESKHNTKDSHQITRDEREKKRRNTKELQNNQNKINKWQ